MKTTPPVLSSETRSKWSGVQVRDLVVITPVVLKPQPRSIFQILMSLVLRLKVSFIQAVSRKTAAPAPKHVNISAQGKTTDSSVSELIYQQLLRNIEMRKADKAKATILAVANESTSAGPTLKPVVIAAPRASVRATAHEPVQHVVPAAVNDAILKMKVDHAAMLQTNREVLEKLKADHEAMVKEDQAAALKAEHEALVKFKAEREVRQARADQEAIQKLKLDHAAMMKLKADQAADAQGPALKVTGSSPNSAISSLIHKQIEMRKLREAAKEAEVNLSNLLQTYSLQQMICKNELEISELKNTLDSSINDDVQSGKAVEILKLLIAQRNRLKSAVKTLDSQVKNSVATIGNHVTEKAKDEQSEERTEQKKKESNFLKILSGLGKKSSEQSL